ncbi:MAG: class I SAM-dependent methyltransferase [Gemmatimonadales bacterium]
MWFAVLGELGYRRLAIRECRLDRPFPETPAKLALSVETLDAAQVDEYVAFRAGTNVHAVRKRLAAGNECFVARVDHKIVSARWAATGNAPCDYLFRTVSLADDEVYLFDAFTSPEWRGKGIFPALTSSMHRHYRDEGKHRSICFTGPENLPAMIADTGYRRIGLIGYVGIGSKRRQFFRIDKSEKAPGESTSSFSTWNRSIKDMNARPHYLDDFLATMKRSAYLGLIERWGGLPSNARILKTDLFEEAMGPDAFLGELAGAGRQVVGMDVSWEAAARARERDTGKKALYVVADARHLPLVDESFALIVSPSTLDHFANPSDLPASLGQLRRILAFDGRLVITLDNRQNIFDPLLRLANRFGKVPFFLGRSYTMKELRRELEASGFAVQDTTAIVHHPRMTGVAGVAIARRLGSGSFTRFFEASFRSMQNLEGTRLRYYSGCFVAALATRASAAAVKAERNQRGYILLRVEHTSPEMDA